MYDLGENLLIVATDRLSAFDVILPDGIPNKGKVLTQISAFWFRKLAGVVDNHLISTDIGEFPEPFRSHPEVFAGRSMVVRKDAPASGGMHRPRVPLRERMDRIQALRRDLRNQASRRTERIRQASCRPSSPPRRRPRSERTTKTSRLRCRRARGRGDRAPAQGTHTLPLHERRGIRRLQGDHHRGHEIRIRCRRHGVRSSGSMRR